MVIEHLKAEQYPMLAEVGDGFVPDPKTSVALVAKDGQGIVGRIFLLAPVHMEGPWVRPDARGTLTVARLVNAAETVARKSGVTKMFAYGASDQLENYLARVGYKQERLTVWTKEL